MCGDPSSSRNSITAKAMSAHRAIHTMTTPVGRSHTSMITADTATTVQFSHDFARCTHAPTGPPVRPAASRTAPMPPRHMDMTRVAARPSPVSHAASATRTPTVITMRTVVRRNRTSAS